MIEEICQHQEMFKAWRHDFHQHPELGFEEHRTAQIVADKLAEWGFDAVHTGIAGTGVVGVLHGNTSSPRAIGLRADMDALQMTENNTFRHASCHQGKMHGCGHDGHTAMLLAAAWYLSRHREFSGTVHFIFQPAEEGLGGAKVMLDEGLFERFPCQRIYGMHNMPGIPKGQFWLREGAILASSDRFTIEISGKGGHAAMPHQAVDPLLALSAIINGGQSIISRNTSPFESAVLSFTDVRAGSGTFNVIPDKATMMGCIRTFDEGVRERTITRLKQLVENTALGYGASASVIFHPGNYPATVNHPVATRIATTVAREVVGTENVNPDCLPLSGSEDFSFMLQAVPGCYLLIGNGLEGETGGVCVHNPNYDFNDDIISAGASLFVRLIEHEMPQL
ncbi:M20 aminoacylase family protein [Vibrio sp. CAU 1672]|uniref:M20 aminoacylase family protein n=1 Tax=Vibrio sp. CAU 1672 TaxID=3032594 RepID=UPI0023DAF70F|nr:M20 aminoacylase family protein [Vibrio sp. CAU 1672]MDF2152517.1 M20 family metallopeptidase [Vibrio sp. CAU 1672]